MTNFSEIFQKVADDYAKSETSFEDWEAWKEHATSGDNHAFNHLFHAMESLMLECCKEGFDVGRESKGNEIRKLFAEGVVVDTVNLHKKEWIEQARQEALDEVLEAFDNAESITVQSIIEALKKKEVK